MVVFTGRSEAAWNKRQSLLLSHLIFHHATVFVHFKVMKCICGR